MNHLELDKPDFKKYQAALLTSHKTRVRAHILNMKGQPLDDILAPRGAVLLDGQVNIDSTADVTRSASLSILDREHRLKFDRDSPADGALFADNMISLERGIWVDTLSKWIDVPIFTGPVTGFNRDGAVVQVEALGKESLLLAPTVAWGSFTIRKGTEKVKAIRRILQHGGEDKFDLNNGVMKLPMPYTVIRIDELWVEAKRIARSMGKQLFYDGEGTVRLREPPDSALYSFQDGDGGSILTQPQITFDLADVRNVVIVKGRPAKGSKQPVKWTAVADASHPFSPVKLGRNGVPRRLVEVIEEDSIRTISEARRLAELILKARLSEAIDVAFEALPVPHLEELDWISVTWGGSNTRCRLRQFSIPLAPGTMTIGAMRTVHRRALIRGHGPRPPVATMHAKEAALRKSIKKAKARNNYV